MEKKSSGKVPVFVFPTSLVFYLGARETHKQLLTIYNPYDFGVRFQVLCTAPHKYVVTDPDGSIRPQCCVDIVIRYSMPASGNCNTIDKFRITMLDHNTKQVLGKRDIISKLSPGEPDSAMESIDFKPMHQLEDAKLSMSRNIPNYSIPNVQRPQQTNYIALITGLVCIFALFMPTKSEVQESTSIPPYLHLSVNLKLVLAYVLGLISMVVFRP